MINKIAGSVAALAMVLSMSGSAVAFGGWTMPSKTLEIKNEDIFVMSTTNAVSSTGYNDQWSLAKYGGDVKQKLSTGVALSDAFSGVSVASTYLPNCGCDRGDLEIKNEDLKVMVFTDATSKTGSNDQWSLAKSWHSDAFESMKTGDAGSTAKTNLMVAYTDFSVSMPEN